MFYLQYSVERSQTDDCSLGPVLVQGVDQGEPNLGAAGLQRPLYQNRCSASGGTPGQKAAGGAGQRNGHLPRAPRALLPVLRYAEVTHLGSEVKVAACLSQLYPFLDELIRQVTINCAERGLLLLRVRDEIHMTIAAYQTLYESSVAFGMRKALQAEERKADVERSVRPLIDLSQQHRHTPSKKKNTRGSPRTTSGTCPTVLITTRKLLNLYTVHSA